MLTSCICGKQLESGVMRCADCQAAYDDVVAVEDAWITPEPEGEISEHDWLELEDFAAQQQQAALECEIDNAPVTQASAEREPVRQRVNGWPGRKARRVQEGRK